MVWWLLKLFEEPGVKHAVRLFPVAYLHRSATSASVQSQHIGKSPPLLVNPAMIRTVYRSVSQCRVTGYPTIDLFTWLIQRFRGFESHPRCPFLHIRRS